MKHGVRAEQHRRAPIHERHDPVERLARKGPVAHGKSLVDHQDVRLYAGRDRECESHVHATRVSLDRLVKKVADIGKGDDLIIVAGDLVRAQPDQRRVEIDVFMASEIQVETCA